MAAKWFIALLVRGSKVDGSLEEERIADILYRLVAAADPEQAYERALALGSSSGETYTDDDGTAVSLEFLGLADLTEIVASEIGDGTEVYSRLISKPAESVKTKEQLTVFEPEWDEGESGEAEQGGVSTR
jgi:Domain of unknown function (DUF4288)